jgi:hypothetical protein
MCQRHQGRRPDARAEVEQRAPCGPDGRPQQHGIEARSKAGSRLQQPEAPAQEGVAGDGLVYNIGAVV